MRDLYVFLQGGLGNQIFQYAAGLSASLTIGRTLQLLPAQHNHHSTRDYRGLFSSGSPCDTPPPEPVAVFGPSDAFARWDPNLRIPPNHSILMRSYFQYLPAILPVIPQIQKEILTPFADLRRKIADSLAIDSSSSAFLHIRRGDYVGAEHKGHWNLGYGYYRTALEKLLAAAEKRGQPIKRIYIVSDDPAWASQQSWLQSSHFQIIWELDDIYGLLVMSLCKGGGILANSTYSWWGAVLGPLRSSAPVVYPNRWFRDAKPDLWFSNWICCGDGDPQSP